jgi:hypothetical protein
MSTNNQHAKNEQKWVSSSLKFCTYTYFSSSPKMQSEYLLFETKGLKLLHNVKSRWISMLFFIKQIFTKYKTMVVNMNDDLHIVATTKTNFQYLYNIEMVMELTCIMPLL